MRERLRYGTFGATNNALRRFEFDHTPVLIPLSCHDGVMTSLSWELVCSPAPSLRFSPSGEIS